MHGSGRARSAGRSVQFSRGGRVGIDEVSKAVVKREKMEHFAGSQRLIRCIM